MKNDKIIRNLELGTRNFELVLELHEVFINFKKSLHRCEIFILCHPVGIYALVGKTVASICKDLYNGVFLDLSCRRHLCCCRYDIKL